MVAQRAVEALVVIIKLDVFEDFTPGLSPAGEGLSIRKTLCFQRTEEGFGLGIYRNNFLPHSYSDWPQ